MDKSKLIEQLQDDDNYYGKLGQSYLSNSDILELMKNPQKFKMQKESGEREAPSPEMLFGRYFHQEILEPEKTSEWETVNVKSRNTKAYQTKKAESNSDFLLDVEVEQAKRMADRLMNVKEVFDMIDITQSDKEVPEVGMVLDGSRYLWKGKADVFNRKRNLVVDLKTTASMKNFKNSFYSYNYHSQAYIYSQLFDANYQLIVIDKNTFQIAMPEISDYAIEKGQELVRQAEEQYYKYVDPKGAGEDASQHVIKFLI